MTEKTFLNLCSRWNAALAAVDAFNNRKYDPTDPPDPDQVMVALFDEVDTATAALTEARSSSPAELADKCRALHVLAADHVDDVGWIPSRLLLPLVASVARDAAALVGLERLATPQG